MNLAARRTPYETAFLVMYVRKDVSPPQIVGITLFSEAKPTCDLGRFVQFTVLAGTGLDYEEGKENIREHLRKLPSVYAWIWPLMDARSRETILGGNRGATIYLDARTP